MSSLTLKIFFFLLLCDYSEMFIVEIILERARHARREGRGDILYHEGESIEVLFSYALLDEESIEMIP